jgi:sulfur carrier protein ThiS
MAMDLLSSGTERSTGVVIGSAGMAEPPTVAVRVRLNGPLADRLGPRVALSLPSPATVADVLEALGPDAAGCAVHIAGRHAAPQQPIEEGSEVAVLSPYAGG